MLEYLFVSVAFIGFIVIGYGALQSTKFKISND